MARLAKNPAQRAYLKRMAVLMTAYIVILFTVVGYFNQAPRDGPLAIVAALLPAVPVIGVFWAIGRLLIEEQDEYLRMLLVRQIVIATGFALTIMTAWGFLESFDRVPHIPAFYGAVLWFAGLGVGGLVNRLTLGSWGQC
ncbi:MAG: hypothetical protein ABIO29_03310 [Sphingomicrobium sp.]